MKKVPYFKRLLILPSSGEDKLPETVTVDGKEVKLKDIPEFKTIMEAIRKQEKNKLYGQIKELELERDELKTKTGKTVEDEKKIKELSDSLAVLKSEKEKLEKQIKDEGKQETAAEKEAREKAEKEAKEKGGSGITATDVAKIVTDALAGFEKRIDDKLAGVSGKVTETEVDLYKKEKLAEFKGLVIPDLVVGKTKEEIDASLKKAVETSKNYITVEHEGADGKKVTVTLAERDKLVKAEEAAKEAAAKVAAGGGGDAGAGAGPVPPKKTNAEVSPKLTDVSKMSQEEYAKNREAILKEAKQMQYSQDSEKK